MGRYFLLTKATAAQNEVALSYHGLCGLYFLVFVFAATIVNAVYLGVQQDCLDICDSNKILLVSKIRKWIPRYLGYHRNTENNVTMVDWIALPFRSVCVEYVLDFPSLLFIPNLFRVQI